MFRWGGVAFQASLLAARTAEPARVRGSSYAKATADDLRLSCKSATAGAVALPLAKLARVLMMGL